MRSAKQFMGEFFQQRPPHRFAATTGSLSGLGHAFFPNHHL
jgi:hypothetical protein